MSDVSAAADIRVVCGPTGAGKSAIAMWLAGRHPCAIVSADSRQVYRGFDIGTAKPTRADQARVPHFGLDVRDPTERYSAAAWSAAATAWISSARAGGTTPLVVGGAGLYLRALFEGLSADPEVDTARRGELASIMAAMSTAQLRRWVNAVDPARAHLGRTQLLRAIEVATLAGLRISDLHGASVTHSPWRPCYLVVDPGPELATWNAQRLDGMIRTDWAGEVLGLTKTTPADAPAWNSTGYEVMRQHVLGSIDLESARQRVLVRTRQYAKRQRTWFRHQLPPDRVTHVNPADPQWESVVDAWWTATGEGAR